jgi:hypothetical protein
MAVMYSPISDLIDTNYGDGYPEELQPVKVGLFLI